MIKIFLINGKAFLWNAEDVFNLRSKHRIVGSLAGCFPRQVFQNSHKWLPLQLLPEEATLLYEKGIANLILNPKIGEKPDAVTAECYIKIRDDLCEQQISKFKEVRKKIILEKADVIYEGKKRKLLEKLHQKTPQRKKRKKDDLQNLPLPSSENNNDSQTRSATEAPPYTGNTAIQQGTESASTLCNNMEIGCDFKGCLLNNNQEFQNIQSETAGRTSHKIQNNVIADSTTLKETETELQSDSTNKKLNSEEFIKSLNACIETSSKLERSEHKTTVTAKCSPTDEVLQKFDSIPLENSANENCIIKLTEEELDIEVEDKNGTSIKCQNVRCLDEGTTTIKSCSRENSIVILDDSSSCNIEEMKSEDVNSGKNINVEKTQDLYENREVCVIDKDAKNKNFVENDKICLTLDTNDNSVKRNLETNRDKIINNELLGEGHFAVNDVAHSNSWKEQNTSNVIFESGICEQEEISLPEKEKSASPTLQSDTEQNTCMYSDSNFVPDQSIMEKNAIIEEEMSKIPDMSKDTCMVQLFTECPWKKNTENVSCNLQFPKTEHERLRYAVFKDLWEKGYYLTGGTKFGGDFLAYAGDPLKFHALFVVVCLSGTEEFQAVDLVVYGRLGNQVKKTVVLASMDSKRTVEYISLNWASEV